nr:prephenate dehydrogenase [Corynebacterium lactis]
MSTNFSPAPDNPAVAAAREALPDVCVLGMGLIGGSMMRDLRDAGLACFGWNRSAATVEAATAEGFDATTDLAAALARAEASGALIVIGTPMTVVGRMLDAIAEHAPACTITDVVSVKGAVAREVSARGMDERFVGAHPMAGSAQAGWDATVEGLFDGAPWVISYDLAEARAAEGQEAPARWVEAFRQVAALGTALGSQLIPATSERHDRAVARISHMPHLAAYAVAAVGAGETAGDLAVSLAAGSFRDGTRVAAAEPDMVMSWCENNATEVLSALDDAIAALTGAREQLASSGTARDLAELGHQARLRYEARPAQRPVTRVEIGAEGWVSQLRLAENAGGQIEVF